MATATIVSPDPFTFRSERRVHLRRMKVNITSLSNGANTVAHGLVQPNNPSLGATPKDVNYVPTSALVFHETQAADATNIYITVDSGAGTTMTVYVTV